MYVVLAPISHTGMLTPVDWRCPRPNKKCSFYLWQEHEAEAKECHKAAECSVPRTPTKANICSYLEEMPSTRKRAAKDSQSLAGKDSSPQITVLSDE
jgi:hypothetical protein